MFRNRCLLVLAVAGCGAAVRTVETGPAPPALAEPVVVEYPPPPARLELLGKDPGEPCYWMDGHWEWAGRRWHWVPGAWVVPPAGCYYSLPSIVWYSAPTLSGPDRASRTELYFTAPRWYRANGADGRCSDPAPCKAVPGAAQGAPPSSMATGTETR